MLTGRMKRPLDDEETMGGNADDPPKRRRGEGPRVELRILLQSKVSAIGEGVGLGESFTSIHKYLHKLLFFLKWFEKKESISGSCAVSVHTVLLHVGGHAMRNCHSFPCWAVLSDVNCAGLHGTGKEIYGIHFFCNMWFRALPTHHSHSPSAHPVWKWWSRFKHPLKDGTLWCCCRFMSFHQ